jgi:glucose-6-phosphate 1-dehydrogenase
MEPPKSFSKEDVREERVRAIKSIRHLSPEEVKDTVVRGQYEGYLKEKDTASNSKTDTYVAMKLQVATPRFADVPFYLRAGKAMEQNMVDIKVVFKPTTHHMFTGSGAPEVGNVLTIRIQPNEGITLRMIAKKPGNKLELDSVDMRFSYQQTFGGHGADAYEKIVLDILAGDQMLFNRSDELESSWQLISNILQGWEQDNEEVFTYKQGTWGPKEADELIEKDGRKWL